MHAEDLIVLSIFAKPHGEFAGYDLLQAISATGMQFGAMNIFHYYLPTETGRVTLFSLAVATEPGEFDLNHLGDFSCIGLTLFMNLRQVPYPSEAFELMINVAEQLAEDLEGELRAGKSLPWSKDLFQQYQEKVFLYEK